MNKKGFTLIELLGAVVIIVALSLVAFPSILNMLNNGQKEVDESVKKFILSAAEECANENPDNINKCKTVENLKDNGYISTTFYEQHKEVQNDTIGINTEQSPYKYTYNEIK